MPQIQLLQGDALDVGRSLPDNSVDLIATDPPYFKVKDEPWDRQWEKPDQFLAWIGTHLAEWRRILKPNGSLYVFTSPKMAARVECEIGKRFNVLNSITWAKPGQSYAEKYGPGNFRQFVPMCERITFAEHYGNDETQRGHTFGAIVEYLRAERDAAETTNEKIDEACGWLTKAFHFFARSGSNFCMPTPDNYAALREAMPGFFRREYEDLRREYEDLRRPFSVTPDVPYTDVWAFKTVGSYPGKHVCEKPLDLMEHIIRSSSREGATVFDPFMGSGTTGVASVKLGRSFIGSDLSQHWVDVARRRIQSLDQQLDLFSEAA